MIKKSVYIGGGFIIEYAASCLRLSVATWTDRFRLPYYWLPGLEGTFKGHTPLITRRGISQLKGDKRRSIRVSKSGLFANQLVGAYNNCLTVHWVGSSGEQAKSHPLLWEWNIDIFIACCFLQDVLQFSLKGFRECLTNKKALGIFSICSHINARLGASDTAFAARHCTQ